MKIGDKVRVGKNVNDNKRSDLEGRDGVVANSSMVKGRVLWTVSFVYNSYGISIPFIEEFWTEELEVV